VSEPPAAARELFGVTLPRAEAYAGMLVGPGVERGLIGPGEASRIWDRHLINSGLIVELLPERFGAPEPGWLLDLGSGAGLPGIVLAILRPDLRVTLIEPMARRTAFLAECVSQLDLKNVEICRARAEELAGRVLADVVTSRAVARLDRLARWSIGVCRPGGLVLAIKGASAAAELEDARAVLDHLGVADARVVMAGQDLAARGVVDQPTTVVRLVVGRTQKSRAGREHHEHERTGT